MSFKSYDHKCNNTSVLIQRVSFLNNFNFESDKFRFKGSYDK